MACKIPYIQSAPISETEKTRLEKEHNDVIEKAEESKFFRMVKGRLQTMKNKYPDAVKFVSGVNKPTKIASLKPIGDGKTILSVDVLPLSQEKQGDLYFQLKPQTGSSKQQVDFDKTISSNPLSVLSSGKPTGNK